MNRCDFLIFAGTLGTGFVSAPFLGRMGRLMPSYYYRHHTNGNSQNQDQGNNNDNCYIRAEEATTSSNDQNGVRYVQPFKTFRVEYSNETYTFEKDFKSDGSMRCDFKDDVRDSVNLVII
jgi:hypothetical protein